ncbi:MAG: ABC transporter ATP-binding protein/permease [Christensenellaceae bacterium]|jgi:ABC-type multidrug transport system fused ATPase/permease subunit|nr:ABC transporter ATP-binding protein/permease [Christensenellaceae bacterium]
MIDNKNQELISLVKKRYKYLLCGVFFAICYASIIVALPLVSKYLIDVVLSTNDINKVYSGILLFFAVSALQPTFFCIKELFFTRLLEKFAYDLRIVLFKKLNSLPMITYDRINYGEVSTRIVTDTKELCNYIYYISNQLLTNCLLIILILVFMFLQNSLISGIILVFFISYYIINSAVSRRFRKLYKNSLENNEKMHNLIKQWYDKSLLTKLFNDQLDINKEVHSIFANVKSNTVRENNLRNLLNGITLGIMTVALAVIYGIGAILIIKGAISLGTVLALGLFFQSLIPALNSFIMSNVQYNKVKPSLNRIKEYLLEPVESGNIELKGDISIKFNNVSFGYEIDKTVLRNINFQIKEPGIYGFVGPSGSGKSTISKLILGLYSVTNGKIEITGENINELEKNSLRSHISYLPQDITLINDTILNNIQLGNKNVQIDKLNYFCELLDIRNIISNLPLGYQTVITDKVNLSGGEKRRIAICRTCVKSADLYIFDEADASLQKELYRDLTKIYSELGKEKIVIVITHQDETLKDAKQTFYLNEYGQIARSCQ